MERSVNPPKVIAEPDLFRVKNPDSDQIQITWVGHSTFLIQMDGFNILTDPIFNDRSSPFSFGGVKRLVPPGLRFEDLPPIHVVLISHNHYDHLDEHTIKRLGGKPKYLIPLGLARWFMKPVHVDPPEAVMVRRDTNSRQSIASHWGTFKLSDEPLGEPVLYLEKALREAGVDRKDFIIMKFGETLLFR